MKGITEKQLNCIKYLAKHQGKELNEEMVEVIKCMSRDVASEVIKQMLRNFDYKPQIEEEVIV